MVDIDTIRAPLFVPANRPDRFLKAAASGADAIILDLEDAVAREEKDGARSSLSHNFTNLPIIVRVNGVDTQWHQADMAAATALPFDAIMLPKAESAEQIRAMISAKSSQSTSQFMPSNMPILALIESAKGLANAQEIARVTGVTRLVFGSIDFCADLDCSHDRNLLIAPRLELVVASRVANIAPPIDGVTLNIEDMALTKSDADHARDIGMRGKLCIHPKQVSVVKEAFTPSNEEIEWAKRVMASKDGAVVVDGAMVDEPVRIRARRILTNAVNP